MVLKNTPKPRPNKNSDGLQKQPSMTHSISLTPAPPAKPPTALPTPGAPQPGTSNPMTHPAHPTIQSSLGTAPAAGGGLAPQQQGTANTNPTGNPLGQLTPQPTQDQRQVRENIQFKDMNPAMQSQTAQQQGLDPYAPLKMVQQGVQGALQQGPSTGPMPNMLAGPYVPPGIEAFPDDMAHLTTLMGQGYAPGASGQEHEFGMNAHAIASAKIQQALEHAQQGVGQEQAQPTAPPPPQAPGAGPGQVTYAPGIPEGQNGPGAGAGQAMAQMASTMGTPGGAPPQAPPGPGAAMAPPGPGGPPPLGAVPPALIAAMMAQAKAKRPVR